MSSFDDVGEFHRRFNLPHFGDGRPPQFLTEDLLTFRIGFILEELAEFCAAHSRKDAAECFDALVDLRYVVEGLAHFMALPLDAGHATVHAANMMKVPVESADDPRSKRNHKYDIVKPEGWVAPDHNEALVKAALAAFGLSPEHGWCIVKGMTFKEFMESPVVQEILEGA